MEIVILVILIAVIVFFINSAKFGQKMADIEIKGYKIYSEQQLAAYRDYLMCQILQKYPDILDKDKVKVVIEAIRDAHIGHNKDYLNGLNDTYQYVFLSYMDRIQEIREILKNENSLDINESFCMKVFKSLY